MRSTVLALVVMLLGGCANTPAQDESGARAVGQVMIAALAPAGSGQAGYARNALSARVSPPVRWPSGELEVIWPDEPNSHLRRRGSLEGRGWRFAVSAEGPETLVHRFSVDVDDAVETEALLNELRDAGAEVSGAGDDESAMFYYVTLPGRDTAQLEARRVCRPFESREARDCRSVMTWNFELQ